MWKEILKDISEEFETIAEDVMVIAEKVTHVDEKLDEITQDAQHTEERLDAVEKNIIQLDRELLGEKVEEISTATKVFQEDLATLKLEAARSTDVVKVEEKVKELSRTQEGACGKLEAVEEVVEKLFEVSREFEELKVDRTEKEDVVKVEEKVKELSRTQEGACGKLKAVEEVVEKLSESSKRIETSLGSTAATADHASKKAEEVSREFEKLKVDKAEKEDVVTVEEKVKELSRTQEGACGKLKAVEEVVEKLSESSKRIETSLGSTASTADHASKKAEEVSREFEELKVDKAEKEDDELPFNEDDCRDQLMNYYRHSRGKITLLPGMPEKFRQIKDLFVNLQMLYEDKSSREIKKRRLESYIDLLSLKDNDKHKLNRILIRGDPGGGKTTTLSKIAYDWASPDQNNESLLKYRLLFFLELRKVQPQMTLADAIQAQLLPRVSKKKLLAYIESNASSIVFLLDGFDEALWLGEKSLSEENQFKILLSNRWLYKSCVLVTTRRYRVSNYVNHYGYCAQVELMQLSFLDVQKFVARFFEVDEKYLDGAEEEDFNKFEEDEYSQFVDTIRGNQNECVGKLDILVFPFLRELLNKPVVKGMSKRPILLTMMCMLWDESRYLPEKTTDVFEEAMRYLNDHSFAEARIGRRHEMHVIVTAVGEVALTGLLTDTSEPKLLFEKDEFPTEILNEALSIGILVMERIYCNRRVQYKVAFLHKDFQEFCAAKYMIGLSKSNLNKFKGFLDLITGSNIIDMSCLIQYCCGLSAEAADMIIPHCVDLLLRCFPKSDLHPCLDCTVCSNDPWILCLLLLAESQSENLCKHLRPLFQRKPFWIKLGENKEYLPALDFFINCQKTLGDESILCDITAAKITVKRLSIIVKSVLHNLLQNVSKLYSLDLELPFNSFYVTKMVGIDITRLIRLKHLILRGEYTDIFSRLYTPNVTHLTIACKCLRVENLRKYLYKMKKISHFSLIGEGSDLPIPYLRAKMSKLLPFWADNVLNWLKSKELRNLSIVNYNVSPYYLRQHLSILNTLHLELLAVKDAKEVISVLYDEARKASKISTKDKKKSPLPLKHLRLNSMTSEVSVGSVRLLINAFKYLPHLTVLNLRESQITEDGFILIGNGLFHLSKLKELNLSNNRIGRATKDICENLLQLPWLEKLLLRRVSLEKEGIAILSISLNNLKKLQVLNLHGNHIGNAMTKLCPSIQSCEHLRELNLNDSELSDNGISQLPFKHMKNLTTLLISGKHMIRSYDDNTDDDGTNIPKWAEGVMSAGVSQCYGPRGIKTLFENLHHLQKLAYLEIKYNGRWNRNDDFLEMCCKNSLVNFEKFQHMHLRKLSFKRKEIDAIIAFVDNYTKNFDQAP
ncbi:NLR family CARD domain-containing protein 4-like isoform X2 [Amphiura filiformis]|uniref:NLR family CARD domain-containing protein 4-like isoform X2 n=1 Tax=Amphiura filiformis TaxID=82378 RepID=UPI003B223A44